MPAPSQANGSVPAGTALYSTPAPVTTSSGGSSSAAGTWASHTDFGSASSCFIDGLRCRATTDALSLADRGTHSRSLGAGGGAGRSYPDNSLPEGTTCPSCGRAVPTGFAFCGACGTRIPSAGAASATGQRPAPVSAPVPRGRIVLIRPDGSEGGAHPLFDGENLVGRGQGSLFEGRSKPFPAPRRIRPWTTGTDGSGSEESERRLLENCG